MKLSVPSCIFDTLKNISNEWGLFMLKLREEHLIIILVDYIDAKFL